jgi:hypothetical protein
MTTAQINKEAKKQAKKICKGQNIVSIKIEGEVLYCNLTDFGSDDVFTWKFFISVNEGNEDCMTEEEKLQFPEMIEKTTVEIKQF